MPQKILNELSTRCEKSVEHLKSTMLGVRTGRAHPALVEEIKVDYFGTPTPIKNMGSVNVPEARQIVITPWDKTAMKAIEKAIQSSSLGITPQNDGSSIRLNLPELTQQRRVELKKMVNKMAEEGRVAVRNIRRDAIEALKKLEKDSKITEDDSRSSRKRRRTRPTLHQEDRRRPCREGKRDNGQISRKITIRREFNAFRLRVPRGDGTQFLSGTGGEA